MDEIEKKARELLAAQIGHDLSLNLGGTVSLYAAISAIAAALLAAQQPAAPVLAKHQPCGCVICTCEDEQQCQGCGAKHCGNRADHPPYVGQQPTAVDEAKETALWRCTVCGRVGTVGRCCGEETREPFAPPSAPAVVEGRLSEVIRFLMGEAPLDGRWFDDPGDPRGGGAYWWRKHLTEALDQQQGGRADD